jgi:hypothetical protein
MIVVGHEAISVANPIVTLINVLKGVKKVFAVSVIFENRLLLVSTGSDMINCAGVFYTERAGHGTKIA